MSPVLEQTLLSKLHALPEEQQEAYAKYFIEELEEGLAQSDGFVLTDELKAELDRRVAEDDAHPELGIPAEIVFAKLKEKLRKARQ